jgi:hypothetical protein
MVQVQRGAQLVQIIHTLRIASRFASGMHRRQQQCHQDAHDRDHDQ